MAHMPDMKSEDVCWGINTRDFSLSLLVHLHRIPTHAPRTHSPPLDSVGSASLSAPGMCFKAFKPDILSACVLVIVHTINIPLIRRFNFDR